MNWLSDLDMLLAVMSRARIMRYKYEFSLSNLDLRLAEVPIISPILVSRFEN